MRYWASVLPASASFAGAKRSDTTNLMERRLRAPFGFPRGTGQTIPARIRYAGDDVREKLDVHDGYELEAHIRLGSVILRPVSGKARERGWERIFSIIDQVRLRPGQPEMTAEGNRGDVRR